MKLYEPNEQLNLLYKYVFYIIYIFQLVEQLILLNIFLIQQVSIKILYFSCFF